MANLAPLRPVEHAPVPLAGDALARAAFDPIAAVIRWLSGQQPRGGDSAEAIEHGFEDLWRAAQPKGAPGWDQPFLSLFYTDHAGTYREGMPLWFANGYRRDDRLSGDHRAMASPSKSPAGKRACGLRSGPRSWSR
jgi:hypothetical protein